MPLAHAHGLEAVPAEEVLQTAPVLGWHLWTQWTWDPNLLLLLPIAILYWRGKRRLHQRSSLSPRYWHRWRSAAFTLAVLLTVLALSGPLDYLANFSFSFHMLQHMLIMTMAMPLLMLSAPLLPILYGLPRRIRQGWLPPLARCQPIRALWLLMMQMLPSLVLFQVVQAVWHLPNFYRAALFNSSVHYLQHFCFLSGAFFFWINVVRPYPLRRKLHPLLVCLSIFGAAVINSFISTMIVFADVPLYGYETITQGIWGISVLAEQRLGAALMWTMGSMLYLLALLLIFFAYARRTSRQDQLNASPQTSSGASFLKTSTSPSSP